MARTAPRPVFFISHSSASLPATDRTVQIRDALATELNARGWDVFLDREVNKAGDRWRTNIVYGLARADAAAILFNDRAISSSDWVTAEALILCFHKSVDPQFQLVPVMLEGKTLADTAFAKYQPFELNQIQAFTDDTTLSPVQIAARLAGEFDIDRGQIVRSRWCERVRGILGHVKKDTLERAAKQLKLELDARTITKPDDVAREWLANGVVTVMHHADPLDVVDSLGDIFIPLDSSKRVELKKHILAKWVPNESVEVLMGAARTRGQISVLTVGNMAANAVEQYIHRVLIEFQGGLVRAFTVSAATGDTADAIVAQVEDTIRQNMIPVPFYNADGSELPMPQAVEQVLARPVDVAICVLPSSCVRESVLLRLVRDYPRIVFVAQASAAENATEFAALRIRPLTPPLDVQRRNQLSMLTSRIEAVLAAAELS